MGSIPNLPQAASRTKQTKFMLVVGLCVNLIPNSVDDLIDFNSKEQATNHQN
jgi:hypothetical protein